MAYVLATTRPKSKMRRSASPSPKYRIGQLVEHRFSIGDNEFDGERGIVKGFAYLSPGYECMCATGSGVSPSPGFSYCILVNGRIPTLANEHDLFPVEEVSRD